MNNLPYFLSIDIGTTSCKVAIFSDVGELVGFAKSETPVYYPQPTHVEANPGDWWEIVKKLIRQILADTKITSDQIVCIGLCGDFVDDFLFDEDGRADLYGHGDGVAGPAVHFDDAPVMDEEEFRVEGLVAKVVDDDAVEADIERPQYGADEVVGEGSRRAVFLDAAVDGGGFVDADEDGEGPLAVLLFEHDELLLAALVDDDAGEFHFDHV